jgi:hypothetical protein
MTATLAEIAEMTLSHLPEIHPTWLERSARIVGLRTGIAVLLEEESRLLLLEQPVLIAEYEARLGALDLERLLLEAACSELRFRIEQLNALYNRGEAITPERLAQIDAAVAEEHALWAARLAQRENDLVLGLAALRSMVIVDVEVQQRCKAAYRRLVRLLHPDVTQDPAASERFWQPVQAAYVEWDADRLETLLAVVQGELETDVEHALPQGMDALVQEIARLEKQVENLLRRQQDLLTRSPFCYRALLRDAAALEDLRTERITDIEQARARRDHLQARLDAFTQSQTATVH